MKSRQGVCRGTSLPVGILLRNFQQSEKFAPFARVKMRIFHTFYQIIRIDGKGEKKYDYRQRRLI